MKRYLGIISLMIILISGLYAVQYGVDNIPISYDGTDTDVVKLMEDPHSYTIDQPEGVSDIIVKTDLERTGAANVVSAVVFDYRGFDTMGESFILLTAIAGSYVILHTHKKKEDSDEV